MAILLKVIIMSECSSCENYHNGDTVHVCSLDIARDGKPITSPCPESIPQIRIKPVFVDEVFEDEGAWSVNG